MSASLSADSAPADPDDELLVAYLDGELDRQQRTEVENRLIDDEPLRNRLTQLQSSWDMLDSLPSMSLPSMSLPSMSQSSMSLPNSLVESTLELAIADVGKQTPKGKSRRRLPNGIGWTVAACLVAAILGAGWSMIRSRRSYHQQLNDLAIVQNLDAYTFGGDLQLMRTLAANPDWSQMVSTAKEVLPLAPAEVNLQHLKVSERDDVIANMSVEQRLQIQSRWERFRRLSKENQRATRVNASAVAKQPDKDNLLKTMRSYAIWRERLPSDIVDRMESNDTAVRREAIEEAIRQSKAAIAKQSGAQLDDATVDVIYLALRELLRSRVPRGKRSFRQPPGIPKQLFDSNARQWFAIRQIFGGPDGRRPQGRSNGGRPDSLTEAELEMIEAVLPGSALETLGIVSAGDPMLKLMTLQIWAEEVIRRKTPWRNEGSILQRYQTLTDTQRETIDLMPPEKMLEALSGDRPPQP